MTPFARQNPFELTVGHHQAGRLREAEAGYRKILEDEPEHVEATFLLGSLAHQVGQLDVAEQLIRRAISLRPLFPEAYNKLALVLRVRGELKAAITAYQHAVRLDPDYADAYNNLGNALRANNQPDAAVVAYRKALALKPELVEAHNNLGTVLKDRGQLSEAMTSYRRALAINPHYVRAHSNLIYAMNFDPSAGAAAIADELRKWNEIHAEPLRHFIQPHVNDRDPNRRLRIGYVSPDFRRHVVGQNMLPLLQHHDHGGHEIFCYASVARPDDLTEQLRAHADVWRDVGDIDDNVLAEKIRGDRIDILVDLTLHMAGNRLLTFARKPAPVQVTYLGYCGSTGLRAMDCRLSDSHFDPLDSDLSHYAEKTLRLKSYWCYQPPPVPPPWPPPSTRNGHITFGCLNNFAKVSPAALDLWVNILQAVPDSRLMLHSKPGEHLLGVLQRMKDAGVDKDRLRIVGVQPWVEYLKTYTRIDIALDPFPYGGGITTCDALWLGVPVVTLSGNTAVGRGGCSILSTIGLPELIADTPEQYVEIAISFATDAARLAELRQTLRSRMLVSPLLDAPAFARDVESAYRQMWRGWCGGKVDSSQ